MPVDEINQVTRQRLLEAAGEVFAEHGFRAATVREICKRAGANVAAVNYHFGDKQQLYAAVLKHAHSSAAQQHLPIAESATSQTAEQRLESFVHSALLRILDKSRPAWHGRLIAREMAEPTPALELLVKDSITPNFNALASIVRDLLGSNATEGDVCLCTSSIVGQYLFYCHAQPVIALVHPHQQFETEDIEQLAMHITRFSIAALKEFAETLKGDAR